MKTRSLILVLLAFCLGAALGAVAPAQAGDHGCSGVTCGCDIQQDECQAECPPYPEPGWFQCHSFCKNQYKECAIACCCC